MRKTLLAGVAATLTLAFPNVVRAAPYVWANAHTSVWSSVASSGAAVDAFGANEVTSRSAGFSGAISNWGVEPLAQPAITLDGAAPGLVFSPPVVFPLSVSGSELSSGDLRLDQLDGRAGGHSTTSVALATGFDASRAVSPVQIATGGATQHVVVSVTLRDPRLRGQSIGMYVVGNDYGRTEVSLVDGSALPPAVTPGVETVYESSPRADGYSWQIGNAQLDTPYVLSLDLAVPNTGATAFTYKPFVSVYANTYTSLPGVDAATTTIADPVLGGTYTFTAGASAHWDRSYTRTDSLSFSSMTPPLLTIAVDRPGVGVAAGGTFDEHVTLTSFGSFVGDVQLGYAGPPGADGYSTPPPPELYSTGTTWPSSVHIAPGAPSGLDLRFGVTAKAATGVYRFAVYAWASGSRPVAAVVTVTVGPALPQASAYVSRSQHLEVGADVDAVSASTTGAGWLGWSAQIYNPGGGGVLHGASITVTKDSPTPAFDPPLAFPRTAGPRDVAENEGLYLGDLAGYATGSPRVPIDVTPVADVDRTLSPSTVPAGGGRVTVTVHVTPRDPALATGSFQINIEGAPCCTLGPLDPKLDASSIVWPTTGDGEYTPSQSVQPTYVSWFVSHAKLGKQYTLSVAIDVPGSGVGSFAYRPEVAVYTTLSSSSRAVAGTGMSVHDDVLPGDFAFASATTSQWSLYSVAGQTIHFAGRQVPTPRAGAMAERSLSFELGNGVDTVDASQPVDGVLMWTPYIYNVGSTPLEGASISIDQSPLAFDPPVTFPHTERATTVLGPTDSWGLGVLGRVLQPSATTGFDVARTVSPATVPVGGAVQTVTVSITPRTATGMLYIGVSLREQPGVIVPESVVFPTAPADSTGSWVDPAGKGVVWWLNTNASAGTTYTLSVQFTVPNDGSTPIRSKPWVAAGVSTYANLVGDPTPGSATTIADPVLGGSITFSVTTPGAVFVSRSARTVTMVDLAGVSKALVMIAPHGDVVAEATSAAGAAVAYELPTATENATVACRPRSGSTFALGTTTVTCSAAGADDTTFSVTVRDTTPPALTVPEPIAADAVGPAGATVTYAAAAIDLVDGTVPLTCGSASGSVFAIGDTTVTCTAGDAHGNATRANFTVHVNGAAEQLQALLTWVLQQNVGPGTSIQDKLRAATGCDDFGALDNEARAQTGKKLTVAQAERIRGDVARIRLVLVCS